MQSSPVTKSTLATTDGLVSNLQRDCTNTCTISAYLAAGMTDRFEKMSLRVAKHMMGVIPDKEENLKMLDAEPALMGLQAPESFDARDKWPMCPSVGTFFIISCPVTAIPCGLML